jgi:hypothetical protein
MISLSLSLMESSLKKGGSSRILKRENHFFKNIFTSLQQGSKYYAYNKFLNILMSYKYSV